MKSIFLACAAVLPLLAHHSMTAGYDDKKTVTLRGTVTKVNWENPHVYVYLDVRGKDGSVATWALEFGSTMDMKRAGWSKDAVKVGDVATVLANPSRDGSKEVWGKSLNVFGKVLGTTVRPPVLAKTGKPAPRFADGHVRFGPEPGKVGYWGFPSGKIGRASCRERV